MRNSSCFISGALIVAILVAIAIATNVGNFACRYFQIGCAPTPSPPTYPIRSYDFSYGKGSNDFVTIRYQSGEFIVNMPNNGDSMRLKAQLDSLGLRQKEICPCSNLLQLWGYVTLAPDNDAPPPPPRPGGGNGSVSPNYLLFKVNDKSFEFMPSTLPLNGNRFPQPSNPSDTVIIGIDDTGVRLSDQQANASTFLFRNIGNPFICNSDWLREGIYGMNVWNIANRRNTPISSEPNDQDGHGTFITGVLSGEAVLPNNLPDNNYIGSPNSVALQFLHAKFVQDRHTDAKLYDALCGVHYALNKGAKVINVSWGATAVGNPDTLLGAFLPTLQAVHDKNALLVASSGNDNLKFRTADGIRIFPAALSEDIDFRHHVICVGAWNVGIDSIPVFSNEDSYVNIYAPGVNITSTFITNSQYPEGKSLGSGTSYATPYVVRIAAILHGLHPCESWENIKQVIINNSDERIYQNQNIRLLNVPSIMRARSSLRICNTQQ